MATTERPYDSKWVNDLFEIYSDGGDWEDMLKVINNTDKTLRLCYVALESIKAQKDLKRLIDEC
jgi:hypothetical protein